MNNTRRIKMFIGAMMLAAVSATGYAGFGSHTLHLYFALAVLALAAVTSRMKVKLPGINGNMSVNLPFLLTAVVNLSAIEAVVVTCVSTVVQCWPRKNARRWYSNSAAATVPGCLTPRMAWTNGRWSPTARGPSFAANSPR